eukprot:SM000011S19111  [mRNA]  locus=s11:980195:980413:- [translate_table: standard]
MNARAEAEYAHLGDLATGLCVFVERLKVRNGLLDAHLRQIDDIDRQVTQLEAIASTLDAHTTALEARLKATG